MPQKGSILTLLFFLSVCSGSAQDLSSFIKKQIIVTNDTLSYASLSTAPGTLSFVIADSLVRKGFQNDIIHSRIILNDSLFNLLSGDTITVSYRKLPVALGKTSFNKDIRKLEAAEKSRLNPFSFVPSLKAEDPFKTKGLNKNGSISRGISFGNNQDVVVNSNLNLQLSGNLTDEIEVLAAVTDNNIPFQAEGNTQQLQEFDRVFIQLSKGRSKLIAGDFVIGKPPGYFLNYLKKSQGGSFSTFTTPEESPRQHFVTVSAGVSKGKFARNRIQGIEGNQGPYRLRGAENELFIIVLSGTERVFIDGQLVKRGQEYDYTIDYNTAEIRFTSRQLITKDKRIIVEFEYSERSYARSLLQFTDQYKTEKLNFVFNVFSEQDNKNKPLLQELKSSEKQLLRFVGDSLNEALTLNVDTVPFSGSEVLYLQKDTLVDGFIFPGVFVYSTDPELARFRVGFSNVGQGRGNYRQIASAANGKVFEWIAPVNGVRQGDYEPVSLLVTPKKKQIFSSAVEYSFTKDLRAGIEAAVSNNDLNTFSEQHSSDDVADAEKMFLEKRFRIDSLRSFTALVNYERVGQNFSPFDRFRSIEFERDWNLPLNRSIKEDQHLSSLQLSYAGLKGNVFTYRFNSFIEEHNIYEGYRNVVGSRINNRLFSFNGEGSHLTSKSSFSKTDYLRFNGVVSKEVGPFRVGVGDYFEWNKFFHPLADTLISNSFGFNEASAFITDADSSEKRYELQYIHRDDYLPFRNDLKLATKADNFFASSKILDTEKASLRTSATYRKLSIADSALALRKPDETILGRVEYNQRFFKGMATSTIFYEAGSGLEAKKQFSYVEVAPGLGYYTWKDYNENGVRELNEFEVAVFRDEARYIRVFIPTNEFVKVYSNVFSGSLSLNLLQWQDKKGIRKALSYFSDQASYRVDKKTNTSSPGEIFNPFVSVENDPFLVSLASGLRNVVYLNRSGTVFSMDHTFQDNRSRSLLVNGFETRSTRSNTIHVRIGLSKSLSLENDAIRSTRVNTSDFFSTRDFEIVSNELLPKLVIQPGTVFRLSILYRYAEKENMRGEKELAFINKAGVEFRYNVASKGSISAMFNALQLNYTGNTNTPVAFEMLESLKAGRNYTWNLSWQRNLSQNMQLSILYDGRTSEGISPIHIGSVQVRAFF